MHNIFAESITNTSHVHRNGVVAMKEWDFHAGYQWTFFSEAIKEMLTNWLCSKVNGASNIDIGSGWYVSVPDSISLDYSTVSLEKNPSSRKILFDLDTIDSNKKIPLEDNSLESATLVSSWQYITRPDLVLKELQRILVPGGKVYIINNDGAGLSKFIRQTVHGQHIAETTQSLGYDTTLTQLPLYEDPKNFWWAVEVTMPRTQIELFPKKIEPELIVQKILSRSKDIFDLSWGDNHDEYRIAHSNIVAEYADTELLKARYQLALLQTYPITQQSVEITQRVKQEASQLSKLRGNPVLLWSAMLPVELDMYDTGDTTCFELMEYIDFDGIYKGNSTVTCDGIKLCRVRGGSILPEYLKKIEEGRSVQDIIRSTSEIINSSTLESILEFAEQQALNDFTKDKQALARDFLEGYAQYLKLNFERDVYSGCAEWLEKTSNKIQAKKVYNLVTASKQIRKIQALVSRKQKIEAENISTMGDKLLAPLDTAILQELRKMLLNRANLL